MYAIASGNYVLCDKDNYAYTNIGTNIARYRLVDPAQPEKGIDEQNGIYVASNSQQENGSGLMQKIVWKNGRLSTDEADGHGRPVTMAVPTHLRSKWVPAPAQPLPLWALEMMKTN